MFGQTTLHKAKIKTGIKKQRLLENVLWWLSFLLGGVFAFSLFSNNYVVTSGTNLI